MESTTAKMWQWRLVFMLLVLVCAEGHLRDCSTPWKTCGSSSDDVVVNDVAVLSCCSAPCYLVKGTNASVSFTVTPKTTLQSAKQKLCGEISSVCVNFPLPHSSVCGDLTCPLQADTQYNISLIIPVQTYYPAMKLIARWRLYDSNGGQVACVRIPVAVTSGYKGRPRYTPEARPPQHHI